jgi:hypothetical protein
VLVQADELPPQRKALLTAFGVLDGDAPTLFGEIAERLFLSHRTALADQEPSRR